MKPRADAQSHREFAQRTPAQRSCALVLYDGYCALCNRSVAFLQVRQRPGAVEYASLQSERGQRLLAAAGLPTQDFDSIVVSDGGRIYLRSAAALRLLHYLRFPWPLLGVLRLVPAFLRDPIYNFIAHNRYRIAN